MALINYVKKEEATGKIAEIYNDLEERMNILPNVVQFHTASPELFERLINYLEFFIDHQSIDHITIAYIRMLISFQNGGEYCVRFQSGILKYLGVSDEDLEVAKSDSNKLNLDNKRKSLVNFVLDVQNGKHENTENQIKKLEELGWTQKDIYDANALGALQKGMVNVVKAFKVEIDF